MKDNFSTQSDKYAKYRPSYPGSLFKYLLTLVPDNTHAWDCGTGNGQVAEQLAVYFDRVSATDISQQQIDNAVAMPNIFYSVRAAEKTEFSENTFALITVAKAIHWFNFDAFYKEARRTLRNEGILAVIGYGLLSISPDIDDIITEFYQNIIGPYWDKERKYIDENYQTIPFPFQEIQPPSFAINFEWTLDHLIGYLETWSAVKHYQKKNGQNPVAIIYPGLSKAWAGAETRTGSFPILLRIAKILK